VHVEIGVDSGDPEVHNLERKENRKDFMLEEKRIGKKP